jgi:hypothetical protein
MHFSRSPFMAFAVTATIGRFLNRGILRMAAAEPGRDGQIGNAVAVHIAGSHAGPAAEVRIDREVVGSRRHRSIRIPREDTDARPATAIR